MDLTKKAVRVGIAASLCMLVSNLLDLKFPFFAILPAVMPISTFFGETIKFGLNRMIGSVIGAVIGVILAAIPLENINMLLIGIGIIIIVYVCNYLKWDSTASIACLVFVAIMVGTKESSAFIYSIHRLFATFIGIAITTIVNNYIFNPDMVKLLKNQAKDIQKILLDIAATKDFSESNNKLIKIDRQLHDMKERLKIYSEEIKFNSKFAPAKAKLENINYSLTIAFEQIEIINYINNKDNKAFHDTKLGINNIDTAINLHKKIFFNEIKNIDKIIDDIS